MGYDELPVCWRSSRRQELSELCEAESGQHSCEVGVVGKVKVEALIEWKCGGIVVDCNVGLSCGCIQGVVVHSGQKLFNISYPNSSASW